MVQVLVCRECAKEAEKTNHVDLYGTYTSLLYGCKHAIRDIKRQVAEEVRHSKGRGPRTWKSKALTVTKLAKLEFKDGKVILNGRRYPASKLKPPEDFLGW